MDGALPLAQTAGELQLIGGEDVANQVAQQPSAVFLGGVHRLVPLLVGDEERVVLQELFTALQGGEQHRHTSTDVICSSSVTQIKQ